MPDLKFLSGIIPFAFAEFIFVVVIIGCCYRSRLNRNKSQVQSLNNIPYTVVIHDYFVSNHVVNNDFKSVYESYKGPIYTYILLGFRICCMLYFLGIACIYGYQQEKGQNYYYFTIWNIDLISLYYILAVTVSLIGVIHGDEKSNSDDSSESSSDTNVKQTSVTQNNFLLSSSPSQRTPAAVTTLSEGNASSNWSKHTVNLGYTVQILFEVAGASALFITVVAFVLLNPEFSFWNVTYHFVTSCSFLVEMYLNSMTVRWEHCAINLFWALLYLIFIWPAVATSVVERWPYDFLDVSSTACFLWYTILFAANIFFYYVWYGFSYLKVRFFMTSTNTQANVDRHPSIAIVGIVVSDDVSSDGAHSPIRQV